MTDEQKPPAPPAPPETPSGIRGLGDLVKKATDALGIPQCGGCQERQKKLNEWFPIPNPLRRPR